MRSPIRRLPIPVVIALSLALVGAACSSKSNDTSTGGSTGSSTPASNSSNVDYSKLSGTLKGSGSSFQQPFNEEVITSLKALAPQLTVNYQGSGSGQGKTDLADQQTNFAGTDSPVADADVSKFKGGAFLYFPTVAAPITVSYNLSGVDKLQLSADTVAKIFQGDITTWNDAAVAADNPGVTLPSTTVTVVHRSDGSGTTSTFTKYLKAAAPAWKLGTGDTLTTWPADSQGGAKNAGVLSGVKAKDGAIGYIDFSDAKAGGVSMAAIKNKDGKYVAPSLDAASAALAKAEVAPNLIVNALNPPGDAVYPITAATYILVYTNQPDKTIGTNLKGFLTYVLNEGQDDAATADFAKLSDDLRGKAVAQLDQIKIGS